MGDSGLSLPNAPIVEAILDIECDLPPGQDVAALEQDARGCFLDRYPRLDLRLLREHQIEAKQNQPPTLAVRHGIQALAFWQEDEKQVVQVTAQGFSFNRLAPYTSLDDYLPEIERCWGLYRGIASPVRIRTVRLRYINRILLPMENGQVQLDKHFNIAPRLPAAAKLRLVGFLNQHAAVEVGTEHQANIVLTAEDAQGDRLPVIFDNSVAAVGPAESEDWSWIAAKIQALRRLKNRVFEESLTETCLSLFQ